MCKRFNKLSNLLNPLIRGFGVFLIAFLFLLKYDDFTKGVIDSGSGYQKFFSMLFYYIDKLGGKFLLVGIFVVIGIIMIIHDYHKKFGKSEK